MRRTFTVMAGALALMIGAATAHATTSTTEPARKRTGAVRSLSVVSASGRTEVVIALNNTEIDISDFALSKPERIVVDLTGAKLGVAPKLYDGLSRGGVVNLRVAQYREDVVRIVLELDSRRQYSVVRGKSDVRIALAGEGGPFTAWHSSESLTPATAVRTVAASSSDKLSLMKRNAPQSSQPRMTVTYQDADIRDVIAAFAAFSGRTIVIGKTVAGTVSAEIRDQPWDVALRSILESQGYAASEDPNTGIITVDSYANIAAKEASEPLATQLVAINYARAGALTETIRALLSRDCTKPGATAISGGIASQSGCLTRGSVVADTTTNTLIITEVESRLDNIIGYIRALDIRTPQVAIKAKIIFVNRTNIEDLGVTYDLGSQNQFFNRLVQRTDPTTFTPIDQNGDGVPDGVGGGTPYDQDVNVISLGGNQVSAVANANQRVVRPALEIIFSTALGKFDLTTFIDALQEVRLADTEAEPSIVTLDNRQASILVGEETPIRVIDEGSGTGEARATVSFKESGILLQVTPHITNNRQILLTLHSERSQLQPAAADIGFTFSKQRADNELLVNDGETAVIGGLTVTNVTVAKTGIPILVDLPLIGRLFGQTRTQEEKRDLLILVTPHIIDEGEVVGGGSRPPSP